MAEHAPTTYTPELVSFEEAAALKFEPQAIDPDLVSISGHLLNNPHMVRVRSAALTLGRTKPELIEQVIGMGALTADGGLLAELVEGMRSTETMFRAFADILASAEARLFSASSAALLAEEAA